MTPPPRAFRIKVSNASVWAKEVEGRPRMPVLSLASGASFVHGCSFPHFIIIIILSRRAGSARAELWACRAPARRAQCLPRAHARGGLLVAVVDLGLEGEESIESEFAR